MNTNKSRLYEGLGKSGSGSGTGTDLSFNGQRAITRNTPGIKSVNPGTSSIIDFIEKVFYPLAENAGDAISVDPGTGGTAAAAPLVSGNFGNWTPLTNPTDQYFDEQLPLRFKADMLAFPSRAIVYLQGQFGLLSTFANTDILLGTLPTGTLPPRRLVKYLICQNIELYLIIETTGEVKLHSKDGFNLPTMTEVNVNDPYYVDCFYCPNIFEVPPPTIYTAHRTGSFARNNCGGGYTGSSVVFSHDYTSTVDQATADALADANFTNDGQAYANDANNGATCTVVNPPPITYTAHRTGSFTRNNCGAGSTGTAVTFTHDYTSAVDQATADALANANFTADGLAFANNPSNGATCSVPSFTATRTGDFTRSNCGDGYEGSTITVTRSYTSGVSQQDANDYANSQFPIDGQNQANANGTCTLTQTETSLNMYANADDDIQAFDIYANIGVALSEDLAISFHMTGRRNGNVELLGSGNITIPAGQTNAATQGGTWYVGAQASDYSDITVTIENVAPNPDGGVTIIY